MISANVEVEVTGDGKEGQIKEIVQALQKLAENEALVGVPADSAERKKEEGSEEGSKKKTINNAELAYIHTNGVRNAAMKKETDDAVQSGTPYPLALQAYIKEHGSPAYRVPPRPFLEPAIEKHLDMVEIGMKIALQEALKGGDGVSKMEALAQTMAGKVKDYFEEDNGWPPNSPTTIEKKGSAVPLVDTGALRQSIHGIIRKRGAGKEG